MCQKININIQESIAIITIDNKSYTYGQLKLKLPKTRLEYELLKVVEVAIKE